MTQQSNNILHGLYTTMRRIRTFEERVAQLYVSGNSAGSMLHLSIGEEGAAAGICAALEPNDSFTTHHRGHGVFLARQADPNRMMAEIAGKAEGYCGGKGGSMHIADMGLGHLGANAIVGGGIPHVVGAGLSYKYLNKKAISVAFFGDGAMQQGVLYESMNMAALWKLPVLFVCINNQYGMGTRVDRAAANIDFKERAKAFGLLTSDEIDGTDVESVVSVAKRLVAEARNGNPGFLSVSCFRFYGHGRMDKSPYRPADEETAGRLRDPIIAARNTLIKRGEAIESELDELDQEIESEMDMAVNFAIAANVPQAKTLFSDVFGPGELQPEPQLTRLNNILAEG